MPSTWRLSSVFTCSLPPGSCSVVQTMGRYPGDPGLQLDEVQEVGVPVVAVGRDQDPDRARALRAHPLRKGARVIPQRLYRIHDLLLGLRVDRRIVVEDP